MKKLLFLFLLLSCISTYTQAQSWNTYDDTIAQVNFDLPDPVLIIDSIETLHTIMYSCEVDSLLGLQVHVFDSAYLDVSEDLLATALADNDDDTLRAIAQIFLFATNSDLLSVDDVVNNLGEAGLEIGLDYQTLESNIPAITFTRYFLINHHFIAFSITGSEDDVPRLMSYKDSFFDSINFY